MLACSAACRAPGRSAGIDLDRRRRCLRQGPPHRPRPQRAGWQVEQVLAQHLAGHDAATQEGDDLTGHLNRPEAQARRTEHGSALSLQDPDLGQLAR